MESQNIHSRDTLSNWHSKSIRIHHECMVLLSGKRQSPARAEPSLGMQPAQMMCYRGCIRRHRHGASTCTIIKVKHSLVVLMNFSPKLIHANVCLERQARAIN